MSESGLICRELVGYHGDTVTIEEHWDVTAPGCPVLVFETGTLKPVEAKIVTRRFKMNFAQWQEIKAGLSETSEGK
jgi:hypothetical protein